MFDSILHIGILLTIILVLAEGTEKDCGVEASYEYCSKGKIEKVLFDVDRTDTVVNPWY
jgi:hypothetical protein